MKILVLCALWFLAGALSLVPMTSKAGESYTTMTVDEPYFCYDDRKEAVTPYWIILESEVTVHLIYDTEGDAYLNMICLANECFTTEELQTEKIRCYDKPRDPKLTRLNLPDMGARQLAFSF